MTSSWTGPKASSGSDEELVDHQAVHEEVVDHAGGRGEGAILVTIGTAF